MTARERLFAYRKIYDQKGSEKLFIEAMKESIGHHQRHCSFYDRLLAMNDFSVDEMKSIEDCEKIPPITAQFFKYHEILSIDRKEIVLHATSSGTQGQRSQVFLDSETLRLGTKMAVKAMKFHGLISILPTNYVILGYEPKLQSQMGNIKVAQGMTRFAPAWEKVYTLRALGNDYEADYFGVIDALQRFNRQKLPVRLLGFPAYLYFLLKKMKETGIKPLKLNKRSVILTGGGWKGYDRFMISPQKLYALVEEYLGIPAENCRDFYSAVEHSVAYPACKNHHIHVPIWSRVIIRDVRSLAPLGFDQPGLLSFISPLVSSMPLSSILMGDMAVLRDGRGCGCGITTPYFEVLGRAEVLRGKSCAVAATEYMKGGGI